MTDQQPHTPPECDHHWISYMQPSIGLSWIRQCSQCRDFDADDLQEQIAAAEQRGKAQGWDQAVHHISMVESAKEFQRYFLENPHRADRMEGVDDV